MTKRRCKEFASALATLTVLTIGLVAPVGAFVRPHVSVPDAPQSLTLTPGNGSLSASWAAPSSDGGSGIVSYTATAVDGATSTIVTTCTTSMTSCPLTGLTNGDTYDVTVIANNGTYDSSPSTMVQGVPAATVASAPRSVSLVAGNAELAVSWLAPLDDGGSSILSYTATATDGTNTAICSATAPAVTCTISLLTNGMSYKVTVVADNSVGASSVSNYVIATPYTVPNAPTSVSVASHDQSLNVSWTAPTNNGGSALTGFVATATDGTSSLDCHAASTAASCSIAGLTNGTSYDVSVVAHNAAGDSLASSAIAATPYTTPDTPTDVAVVPGNASAVVSWTAPANGGNSLWGYVVSVSDGVSTTTHNASASETSLEIARLTNGTSYTFWVVARNTAGDSSPSATVSTTPYTVPDSPTLVSLTAGDGSLTVSWSAPSSNGGDTISQYTATATDGTSTHTCRWTSGDTSCTITELTNGTLYAVSVVATNAAGSSLASASTSGTPYTNPDTPGNVSVTVGNGQATVSWTAPASNGSSLWGYVVSVSDGTITTTTNVAASTTTVTLTGLTNGTLYSFSVYATNTAGNSTASIETSTSPYTVPNAPSAPTLTRSLGTLDVSWNAPTFDGGDAITSYTVSATPNDGGGVVTCSWSTGDLACTLDVVDTATYSVTVIATNTAGNSLSSSATSSVGYAVPGAPTGLSATVSNATITLAFTAPIVTGGQPITDYVYSLNDASEVSFASTEGPFVITGLNNGTQYRVKVAAVNAIGVGGYTLSLTATPATTPGVPRWFHGKAGNHTATLMWNPPLTNGGAAITSYLVSDQHGHECSTSTTTCTVNNLVNGTRYSFVVTARNEQGSSTASNTNVVAPGTAPSAPTIVSGVGRNQSVVVTFTAPTDNGGFGPTGYDVSSNGGTTWLLNVQPVSANSLLIGRLVNGQTYQIKIRARNGFGPGPASNVVSVKPVTVPTAPRVGVMTITSTTVTVNFAAPVSNGFSAITTYQYSIDGGATWHARASGTVGSPLVITGLSHARSYLITLRAVNAVGGGSPAPLRIVTTK